VKARREICASTPSASACKDRARAALGGADQSKMGM
jgi:hypothetical protein